MVERSKEDSADFRSCWQKVSRTVQMTMCGRDIGRGMQTGRQEYQSRYPIGNGEKCECHKAITAISIRRGHSLFVLTRHSGGEVWRKVR